MSAHTPGPWAIRTDLNFTPGGSNVIVAPADGGNSVVVAECWTVGPYTGSAVNEPEGLANAHLIAAAPEMLAALKDAYAYINLKGSGQRPVQDIGEVLDVLGSAIAKAEGDNPSAR